MSAIKELLTAIDATQGYNDKLQLLSIITYSSEKGQLRLNATEADELFDFAFEEMGYCIGRLGDISGYREKIKVLDYIDGLLTCITLSRPNADSIAPERLAKIREYGVIVSKERFIEYGLGEMFESGNADRAGLERILCMVTPLKDEFHRGMFLQGLVHYGEKVNHLDRDTKAFIARYVESEMRRYCASQIGEDEKNNLEYAADICACIMDDSLSDALTEVVSLGFNNVNYFALSTQIKCGLPIKAEVVEALAKDVEYASLAYSLLKSSKKLSLFPSELCDEVYLAESDMVQWLKYPTELGRAPDEIEYLGRIRKGEVYHIFKFKSESDTLSDDLKGKWLIGWSGSDGGTFSNFDKLAEYEQKTPEKTLKYIKKKLL